MSAIRQHELLQLLLRFSSGEEQSLHLAGRIEVALDEIYGAEEPYSSLSLALASFRPGGGDFLYDGAQITQMMAPIVALMRRELRE